jgi:hypothetical protein
VAGKSAEKASDLAELNQLHLGQAKDKLIKIHRKSPLGGGADLMVPTFASQRD